MTKSTTSLRTCIVCGQKKPLTAFLELVGIKGHTYGDICATCRGIGSKQNTEGTTEGTASSRLQIDNKAKVQLEHERQERLKHMTEIDHEQKIKKEATETKKTAETQEKNLLEKKYRESFLEQKKPTTNASKESAAKETQTIKNQGFYTEKTRITQEANKQAGQTQLGQKTTGLTAAEVQRFVSKTGRSAKHLFGNMLGAFLDQHFKESDAKSARKNLGQFKQAETKTTAKETGDKSENKENLATEFIKNTLKKSP